MKLCMNTDCSKKHYARGLCRNHYNVVHFNTKAKARTYRKHYVLKNKARIKDYLTRYFKTNRPYARAAKAAYKARKLNATPSWANTAAIKLVYNRCPEGYEVDHIVPLKGKNVCGLHVEWNLQYLTPKENRSKGNR